MPMLRFLIDGFLRLTRKPTYNFEYWHMYAIVSPLQKFLQYEHHLKLMQQFVAYTSRRNVLNYET
jgi:hypothetical protein